MEVIKKTILQVMTTGLTQGDWNATLNVPNLTSVYDVGYMWYVAVAGNTVLGEIDEWNVGDAVHVEDPDDEPWDGVIEEQQNDEEFSVKQDGTEDVWTVNIKFMTAPE